MLFGQRPMGGPSTIAIDRALAALSWRRGSCEPALDGVRAVACLSVFVFHSWLHQPDVVHTAGGGPMAALQSGVDLFFVLSGYLLFGPYARWILGDGPSPSYVAFIERRLRRVVPAYWVCLTLLVAGQPIAAGTITHWLFHLIFLQNVLPGFRGGDVFGVFWTMAIEVQFYLLLPGLAWCIHKLAARCGPRRAVSAFLLASALVTVGTTLISLGPFQPPQSMLPMWHLLVGPGVANFLFVFACGVALRFHRMSEPARHHSGALAGTMLVGIGIMWVSVMKYPGMALHDIPMGAASGGVVLLALDGPRWIRATFAFRPLRMVGLVSFSFYLWHVAIVSAVIPRLTSIAPISERVATTVAVAFPLTLAAATVSYILIERPWLSSGVAAFGESRAGVAEHAS